MAIESGGSEKGRNFQKSGVPMGGVNNQAIQSSFPPNIGVKKGEVFIGSLYEYLVCNLIHSALLSIPGVTIYNLDFKSNVIYFFLHKGPKKPHANPSVGSRRRLG